MKYNGVVFVLNGCLELGAKLKYYYHRLLRRTFVRSAMLFNKNFTQRK